MELDSHCIICLLYSYQTILERRAFIEALLDELNMNPHGHVFLCSDCYIEVTGSAAARN
jgi:hypothetical protein